MPPHSWENIESIVVCTSPKSSLPLSAQTKKRRYLELNMSSSSKTPGQDTPIPTPDSQPTTKQQRIKSEEIDLMRSRVDATLATLLPPGLRTTMTHLSLSRGNSSSASSAITTEDNHDGASTQHTKVWVVDPFGDRGIYIGDLGAEQNDHTTQSNTDIQSTRRELAVETSSAGSSSVGESSIASAGQATMTSKDGRPPTSCRLPHGSGRMEYDDGRVYVGSWENGHWNGHGTVVFSNGDRFEGEYHMDQRHGKGRYEWVDGRIYIGGFQKDQRHGQGVYTWPDGARYKGAFAKGLRHGFGTYAFRDGSVYEGNWQRGKYHGQGECRWINGRIYTGEWVAGKAHGQGKEIRPDGTIRHDGAWREDRPVRNETAANDGNSSGSGIYHHDEEGVSSSESLTIEAV